MADEELSASEATDEVGEDETGEAGQGPEAENRRARRAAAARARKNRLRERQEAEAVGLDAQEMLDDALVRSQDTAAKWFRKNWNTIQWTIVGGLALWGAWGLYDMQQAKGAAAASDLLDSALAARAGRIEKADEEKPEDKGGVDDPTPVYPSHEALLADAEAKLAAATQVRKGSGTEAFGRLALAAVKLEQGKTDEARVLYESVRDDKLAASYPELKGRAIDGLAIALEAKGDLEAALAQYKSLTDVEGFAALGLMQQVRLLLALKNEDAAKEALKALNEKQGAPTDKSYPSYLEQAAKTYSEQLDPSAIKPAGITEEQLRELQEQMRRSIEAKVPKPAGAAATSPSAPASGTAPSPAPVAPSPASTNE